MRLEDSLGPVTIGAKTFKTVEELAAFYGSPEFESQYTYYGTDLGAVLVDKDGCCYTQFKLWSPAAEEVKVRLYTTGSDAQPGAKIIKDIPMTLKEQGVYEALVPEDLRGVYYTFLVSLNHVVSEIADPYAAACGVNGQRAMVIDLNDHKPAGWDEDPYRFTKTASEAVIWEVHIRDFSFSPSSGMTNRGKYVAFTEKGTSVWSDSVHPTGIDYLKALGVTHVHLLPVFDYATVDEASPEEQYNWGYDPLNYNVPEGSYATDPFHGEVRVREFREMVKSLHEAGIGVIMDVVYNHTYHSKCSWFHQAMPYYYHRVLPDGRFADATACGCETASERSMMRLYMLDSLRHWAVNYHIDGFRFDLMAVHDTDTVNEIRDMLDQLSAGKKGAGGPAAGKNLLMYGEPWAAGAPSLPKEFVSANMTNSCLLKEGIAVFSDKTRDTIKGSCFTQDDPGFINGKEGLEAAMAAGIRAYHTKEHPVSPARTITYASAHDNFTLWDKIYKTIVGDGSGYDDPEMMRIAVNKLAAAVLLTSQGIVFFQAGEEFARTKYGDGNSYKSPSLLNALDWSRSARFNELNLYYQGLIAIRKTFSCFTDASGRAADSLDFCVLKDGVIAYTILGQKKGEPKVMALIFNAGTKPLTVSITRKGDKKAGLLLNKESTWQILANEASAGVKPIYTVTGCDFRVHERGVIVAASTNLL